MLCMQLRRDSRDLMDRVYLYTMPASGKKEDFREEDLLGFVCISNGSNTQQADIGLQFGRGVLVLRGDLREKIIKERAA